MDEKISKLFLPLVDKLYNQEPSGVPFRKPVDPAVYQCWDYYKHVKHPIDLSTIRQRVVAHHYKGDAWRFIADVQLMFANAYLFNRKGTPVWEYTNKLSKIWYTDLNSIMQRLNYCCGTLYKFGPQLLFCLGTTPDRYCQIAIGAKYKCYQDSFSFCLPCFNKINKSYISIQELTCEITRMKLPTEPVKKSDFIDCTNDHWQYEAFIQCTQCNRRIHQVCDLYPADDDEIAQCAQHEEIEQEHKEQCRVPPEYQKYACAEDISSPPPKSTTKIKTKIDSAECQEGLQKPQDGTVNNDQESRSIGTVQQYDESRQKLSELQEQRQIDNLKFSGEINNQSDFKKDEQHQTVRSGVAEISEQNGASTVSQAQSSLDDELLQFARSVEDSHSNNWAPGSPNPDENVVRFDSAKDMRHRDASSQPNDVERSTSISRSSSCYTTCNSVISNKNSVDNIAARLSINKLSAEGHVDEIQKLSLVTSLKRDKFVCNHCYRKKRLGFNLRHRKFSARRLPHTRMSRYLETKVNEYIRDNSPTAGEMTIRVLAAYRDRVEVKSEMKEYLKRCRSKDSTLHPNLEEYPDDFEFTTRAIFAWQEIDGVDVCVFGMHVQEYGEDCPEPNRQVVYLSYLDSVHFFRPKQFRTAVYHEILLSYFKYVKKLGFRRVFIWVCPSRKGDDYIFYRHPSEQKMPTLKRLSDWYVHLLDKGVVSGIVERHQNIYEYAMTENWSSILSMPYLSGDYWPGEFERLLNTMIESQKKYDEKMSQKQEDQDDVFTHGLANPHDISDYSQTTSSNNSYISTQHNRSLEQHNILSLSSLYQKAPTPNSGKMINLKSSHSLSLKASSNRVSAALNESGDYNDAPVKSEECRFFEPYTPNSTRSDDQPLDLSSKSNSAASPASYYDDDQVSDTASCKESSARKRRKKSSATLGYTKKRSRTSFGKARAGLVYPDNASKSQNGSQKGFRQKSSSYALRDTVALDTMMSPEEEMIKNLEKSLKRQKEGFIVVRLSECDCSPHFESQRRKEEVTFTCDMMKGREPFLQLARVKNYEFSTLRRAKFSSLAMVKHLGESFKLEPICNECFSFDSSKRHYTCPQCKDYYLCTSCHEITHHEHIMSLMAPSTLPDIDEFLQQCSLVSGTNSISSASSTISNKSFNDTSLEVPSHSSATPPRNDATFIDNSIPLHRHLSNTVATSSSMPLSCKRQRNREPSLSSTRAEDEENANVIPFTSNNKLSLTNHTSPPPPSHPSGTGRNLSVELDQVIIENFTRHAELNYDIDFDEMKSESKKLLSHYWACPAKETCIRCKFVLLSCSFMSVLMRSTRLQMVINCPGDLSLPGNGENLSGDGINLTTNRRFS